MVTADLFNYAPFNLSKCCTSREKDENIVCEKFPKNVSFFNIFAICFLFCFCSYLSAVCLHLSAVYLHSIKKVENEIFWLFLVLKVSWGKMWFL